MLPYASIKVQTINIESFVDKFITTIQRPHVCIYICILYAFVVYQLISSEYVLYETSGSLFRISNSLSIVQSPITLSPTWNCIIIANIQIKPFTFGLNNICQQ